LIFFDFSVRNLLVVGYLNDLFNMRYLLLTTLLILRFAIVSPLRADMMIPMPIEELSSRSDLILRGKVASMTVLRDADGGIYTQVRLEVTEVWKGSLATNYFVIAQAGGVLGDEATKISGQIEYQLDEEVVAFLRLNKRGEGVTLGLGQGKFNLIKDSTTGEVLARNHFHGGNTSLNEPDLAGAAAQKHIWRGRLSLARLKLHAEGGAK
jgi:hypothetical protein